MAGSVILGMGLFVFNESVQAWLGGQQSGYVNRLQMSNRVSADISAIISLFLVVGAAAAIYAGIAQTFPGLERRRWLRWITGLAFGTLLLLILLLCLLVVADRLFRL